MSKQTLLVAVYADVERNAPVENRDPLARHIIHALIGPTESITHDRSNDYWATFSDTVAQPGILDVQAHGVGRVTAAVEV